MKYASVPLQKGVDLGYVKIIDKKLLHKGLRQNWRPGLTKPNVCIYGHAAVLGNIWKPPRERETQRKINTQRRTTIHKDRKRHAQRGRPTQRERETDRQTDKHETKREKFRTSFLNFLKSRYCKSTT